jgi:hypothetical protein
MAQIALVFDQSPAPFGPSTPPASTRTEVGFQIGWDHARHGLLPPPEHLLPGHPVREGWSAGRACFGPRTAVVRATTQPWLHLRLTAWRTGRSFEDVQVTPHYLAQLATALCPVTREPLVAPGAGQIERLQAQAAYAAGHLAMLSVSAWQAHGQADWQQAMAQAERASHHADGRAAGLTAAQWRRLAVLISLVTPLAHHQAAALPLCVLPPNRLRLLNPIQGLQALVSLQLTHADWQARIARLVSLLRDPVLRRDFHLFFHSLLPRVWDGGRPLDARELRQRIEDAWCQPQVVRRWYRFALHLDAERTQALVVRAASMGLDGQQQRLQVHAAAQATEGWAMDSGGFDLAAVQRGQGQASRVNSYPAPAGGLALRSPVRRGRTAPAQYALLS